MFLLLIGISNFYFSVIVYTDGSKSREILKKILNILRMFSNIFRTRWKWRVERDFIEINNRIFNRKIWNDFQLRNFDLKKLDKVSNFFGHIAKSILFQSINETIFIISITILDSINIIRIRNFLQEWGLTKDGLIRHHGLCLTLPVYAKGTTLLMQICDGSENQKWRHLEGGLIRHSRIPVCVDSRYHAQKGITAEKCDSNAETQRWHLYNHNH